jgi:hypothetical protein
MSDNVAACLEAAEVAALSCRMNLARDDDAALAAAAFGLLYCLER